MKPILTLSTAIILLGLAASDRAVADPITEYHDDDHEMFYDDLLPYGEWIALEPGLHVWRPRSVHYDWQPYSHGRWVWTRHGWYWMSSEPFGWAVFHYGRWSMHPRYGWVWYPDRVWGPAWVEWRYGDAYVGWAPLPPLAVFHVTFGIRFTRHWVAPVHSWCFVPYASFGSVIRRDHILPYERVRRIIGTTRRGRTAWIERDMIVNRGIDRDLIERRGGTRIREYEVGTSARGRSEEIRNGRIESYRPDRDSDRIEAVTRTPGTDTRQVEGTRQTSGRSESRRENITRPQQDQRQSPQPAQRPGVRDRRVAPSVRSQPERSAPSQPSRPPDRTTRRNRDN